MAYEILEGEQWSARARSLREEGWWLADLTVVDRLHLQPRGSGRFEIVVQLLHHERKQRQSLRISAAGDPPSVPSVVASWPSARALEREAFDLFGIHFEGHENLTRILLPDEWEGHPLRKDYGVGKVTVEFLPQPFLQVDAPGQGTSTTSAHTEVDRLGQSGPARPPAEGDNRI